MKKFRSSILLPIVGGILLISAGVIFLLNNLGMITLDWEILIGPLFVIGGLAFLIVFILNTNEWWALIPGLVLIALGIIIFMDANLSGGVDQFGGAIFLGFVGLAFLLIYVTHTDQWWAVIPGGTLLTLAGVTLIPGEADTYVGAVFFLGMALTFALVYILPKPGGRMKWALYPASILALVGVLVLFGATNLTQYILPLSLLIIGGFVLYRALIKK